MDTIKKLELTQISSTLFDPIGHNKEVVSNHLIVNSEKGNLLNELKSSLSECERFSFCVAFLNFSGLQLLLDTFKELEQKGVQGNILTSTYLNFTEPKALKRIKKFSNINLKVFIADKDKGFHTKAYLFEYPDYYKIIIGSSNITQSALKSNVEWNAKIISKKEDSFANQVFEEFLALWDTTAEVDDAFLESYSWFIQQISKVEKEKVVAFHKYELIKPNAMQSRALENLDRIRRSGESKALVVAATGTGKTYMAAFDVTNFNPKKILFIVHREEILKSAESTFKRLAKNKNRTTGLLTGTSKDLDADFLFSTIQSMNNHLESFDRKEFQYLIIDEAHHSSGDSYQRVLDYFEPEFVLGMTATPERCDDHNIFDIYDNNVALELRLREALELNLVIPFHYFGITDFEGVDLSGVDIDDVREISQRLKINERVDFILEKMDFYGHDGQKRKCVGFCVSIDHAQYMAAEFHKRGINSVCLTGKDSAHDRELWIRRLEDDSDELEVIFTVDIFNEGVDIPSINLVLMLRPTDSPIVFIQQLGRGLRKHEDKQFLTVLDFIGNHSKAFLIAIALNGSRYYDKDSLKVAVATQFASIPGCTNIQMDRISQDRILQQLEVENFNTMKYLKEEYNEFKKMNAGRIPYFLMDYIRFDGAPDPLKFLSKASTYIEFVAKVEKNEQLEQLLVDEVFKRILKELTDKLPLKRMYEFGIIKYLLKHDKIDVAQAKAEIVKYIRLVDDASVLHALKCLAQSYYDSGQLKSCIKCFVFENGVLRKTEAFERVISDQRYRVYIEDVIHYGMIRYEMEFGNEYYGVPFLKLYEQYQMMDLALLSNYEKMHSSFRGSGLITNGNDYFLFIDLHKDEDIKESINYKDKFIDEGRFQWQTPNSKAADSVRGRNIVHNKEKGIHLHLFVRKYKQIDTVVQPYVYIGKGISDPLLASGDRPITVQMQLEQPMPMGLYTEFVKKV